MEALEKRPEAFTKRVHAFLESMASHFVLDDGNLMAARAGMSEHLQNRAGREVREFGLYGDADGSTDEDGLPIRGGLGQSVPRPGRGRLRAHPHRETRVDQQHPVHRHRVRVGRAPDGPPVPRAGDRPGPRPQA